MRATCRRNHGISSRPTEGWKSVGPEVDLRQGADRPQGERILMSSTMSTRGAVHILFLVFVLVIAFVAYFMKLSQKHAVRNYLLAVQNQRC